MQGSMQVLSPKAEGGPAATDAASSTLPGSPERSPTAAADAPVDAPADARSTQTTPSKALPTRALRAAEGSSLSSGPGSGHITIPSHSHGAGGTGAGSAGSSGMTGSRGWRGKRSASHRAAAAAAPSIASLSTGPSDLGKHDQVLALRGEAAAGVTAAASHSGQMHLSGAARDRPYSLDHDDGGSSVEGGRSSGEYSPIVDLDLDCYFSCAVGRKRSLARFSLPSTEDVVSMLMYLADCAPHTETSQ